MRLIATLLFFVFLYLLTGAITASAAGWDWGWQAHDDAWAQRMQDDRNAFQDRQERQQEYYGRHYNQEEDDN